MVHNLSRTLSATVAIERGPGEAKKGEGEDTHADTLMSTTGIITMNRIQKIGPTSEFFLETPLATATQVTAILACTSYIKDMSLLSIMHKYCTTTYNNLHFQYNVILW